MRTTMTKREFDRGMAAVKDLSEKLGNEKKIVEACERENKLLKEQIDRQRTQHETTCVQIDDLKARLATAEAENQRMRGYIQRVQEDDVVREELVPIGEPGGTQMLVPKRKSTKFREQQPMAATGEINYSRQGGGYPRYDPDAGRARQAKHWVTY